MITSESRFKVTICSWVRSGTDLILLLLLLLLGRSS